MSTAPAIDGSSIRPSAGTRDSAETAGSAEHTDLTAGLLVVVSAPAGWYDIDDDTRRWFDGRAWTDHYAPVLKLVPDLEPAFDRALVNNGFHAIMVIMTLGVWAPIWIAAAAVIVVRARAHSNIRSLTVTRRR